MLQIGRRRDLLKETLGPDGGCEFRQEDLDRDLATVLDVTAGPRSDGYGLTGPRPTR